MNAMNQEILDGLDDAWIRIRDDDEIWCAIINGAGERAFSAGVDLQDISDVAQVDDSDMPQAATKFQPRLLWKTLEVCKPIIAAVNGYCLAGGLELALACDFIIASDNSYFGLPEVSRAIIPVGGGTQRLPRTVHFRKALEMLLTGDRMGAQEAYNIGLVNKVVPHSDLMSVSDELANKIISNGPLAVRAIKELAYKGMDMTLEQGLSFEKLVSDRISATEDAKEGPLAFTEKRKAVYKGR
ncbi:MAG TPA: enoyl-CoA hydratase/isomerase family protein [Alphaproteobacteria bacterium]|nr:enoyl-CoA hydratase/isomerase family protein [Alphaproteobacteria bacterium]